MQLKFKKICLFTTVIVYCASFLLQSNFAFIQARDKETNVSRVNIVAILVDSKIYDWISDGLKWYASDYVQKQLSDTKALVIPLDLENIHAYDIFRMMENIYFDGLKDVNSSLVWLIMFWDIPLPVVNQNWYIFPTVYPYVDFEDQKYVRDPESEYFVPNGSNPAWQAEIWHWLINYWTEIGSYRQFFAKLENDKSFSNGLWYDDFIAQKKWFLSENFPYYRNRVMFAEDIWYQRFSPLMKKLFRWEQSENAADLLSGLKTTAATWLWEDLEFTWFDKLDEINNQWMWDLRSAQMTQQEIQTSFISDYSDLFSKITSSTMRENVFAWGRWIKEYDDSEWNKSLISNADSSAEKLQLKDDILLWNENLQWLIENLNELMEDAIDKKIQDEKYSMDIVVPISYKKVTSKRIWFKRYYFVDRFENYYFWNNARLIDEAEDLSIYRWTYRNLSDLDGVTYQSLATWNNSAKWPYDKTDLSLKSIWWSYDIFSNQVEWNRGYTMMSVQNDLDIYDENKTAKDSKKKKSGFLWRVRKRTWPEICDDSKKKEWCEILYDFAQRRRWWASPINLDTDSISSWRYWLSGYLATDSWRPIYDMWWFQSLLSWNDEWMSGTWWMNWYWTWPQWAASSFKAYLKYASPTQREWWRKMWWGILWKRYEYYENHTPDVHMPFSGMDYFKLDLSILTWVNRWSISKDSLSDKIFNIFKSKSWRIMEQYSYKVISSIVKHKSTTDEQINWIDHNRYWEDWILEMYYNDVKSTYSDLSITMSGIVSSLSWLMQDITNWNNFIERKFVELWEWITNLTWSAGDLTWWSEGATWVDTSWIVWLLDQIDSFVGLEHNNLSGFYNQVQWLYTNNIVSMIESIIYVEWWNIDDYYSTWDVTNLVTIWFLPIWIYNIKNIKKAIVSNIWWIVESYDYVWSWINNQILMWNWLRDRLYENDYLSWDEVRSKVDAISEEFDNIFWFDAIDDEEDEEDDGHFDDSDDDNEEESDEENFTWVLLTWWTVRLLMNSFSGDLDSADSLFSKVFKIDTVWPKIASAATEDSDFMRWLVKNEINFEDFDQSDWINQYVQWTKWPWYDSEWARINHDLLQWVSEHITWMNILTPDRPIDSPRYVSMQSVAWNEIKFIYPDLFKVEVYKKVGKNDSGYYIHELLTWGQIKNNLEKYLLWKVYEYNRILENECNKAKKMNVYYEWLKNLWYVLATPLTWEHGCMTWFTYDEFVEVLWWEKMLDTISETLYYQNLTNKKKFSSNNIDEDIGLIKQSFNINDKRKQILKDYLVAWNEKTKNAIFEIPTYEPKWYEVAFINSDWKDYIFPDASSDSEIKIRNEEQAKRLEVNNKQTLQDDGGLKDECNIPSNWRLPLFSLDWWSISSPWYEWFKCWLEKTRKSPLKLELRFDNSLWEILSADSFWDYIKNSDLGQNFKEWWDEWGSIFKFSDWYDSDKKITQLQVGAEKHNKDVVGWDSWSSNLLSKIDKYLKIDTDNVLLSDSNPQGELKIVSTIDVWQINVEFIWTWDGCISIDSGSLCDWNKKSVTFNPKENPFVAKISTFDHVAWKIWLIIRIYAWWGYIEKIVKFTVSPSALDKIEILTWDNVSVAWMLSPLEFVWYDIYWNKISWWLENYYFEVSMWEFLRDWVYQTGFFTNDFRDLNVYYRAPVDAEDWSVATIQVKDSDGRVLKTLNQKVITAKPIITLNWTKIYEWNKKLLTGYDLYLLKRNWTYSGFSLSDVEGASLNNKLHVGDIIYRLNKEDIYSWWKLLVSNLHRLDIDIRDLKWNIVDIDSKVSVKSQNWFLILWEVNKDWSWNDVFSETTNSVIRSGHVSLYYYPTTIAWDDIVSIEIPWLDVLNINISILAWPMYYRDVRFVKDGIVQDIWSVELDLWQRMLWEVFASDARWNAWWVGAPILNYDASKLYIEGSQETWFIQYWIFNWYWPLRINWTWEAWLAYLQGIGDANLFINVNGHLLPETGLNVMYLNYFWNDWWNQWWYLSNNNKHVEALMKDSNIITTTTMLASEDKIKKSVRKVDKWLKIANIDEIDTNATIENWKIYISIWWIAEMNHEIPSFVPIVATLDTVVNLLNNDKDTDRFYFIPDNSVYTINNWILYSSGEQIVSIIDWKVTLKLNDQTLDNWDNVWDVLYWWVNYWKIILHFPSYSPEIGDFYVVNSVVGVSIKSNRYSVSKLFANGSSDSMTSIWIFDMYSEFSLESNYKSIQDSYDIDEKIWFQWDFKNITLFWEWEIVWEATKKFGSELLINLWDPLLSRIDWNENVYGTDYDWWIWQEIYSDPAKDIFWAYQIDFNNDWLKDWLVVYLDWRLKLTKNYGWNPNLRDMQELMRIAVPIKDVFVGDADGNHYDDIYVLTENNQIRVYLNKWWKFDVDGNVVCLNQNVFDWQISSTPSNLKGLTQFFVEDMDVDGITDIVTYDGKWYVKVFYWGSNEKWSHYLSKDKYACDSWWYDREVDNTVTVTALWTQISSENVYDNSMMYRVGLSKPDLEISEDNLSDFWVNFDPNSLSSLVKVKDRESAGSIENVVEEVMSEDKFDVSEASKTFVNNESKYVDVTLYENTLVWWWESKNYTFVPISFLSLNDKCSVWKNYRAKSWVKILSDGDIVTVRVTVKANSSSCIWAYWDVIQWPWNVYYDSNNIIKWIRFLENKKDSIVKMKDWNFSYIVDNIKLLPWERMVFEYDLEYHAIPLKNMSISYVSFWSNDELPDIKLQSVDWCVKDFSWFVNVWNRRFQNKSVPLQKYIDKEYEDEDSLTYDYSDDVIKNDSDVNQLPWMVKDKIDRIKLLKWMYSIEVSGDEEGKHSLKSELLSKLQEWSLNFNIDLSIFEEQLDKIENIVDDITKWMCNWFSFWWSNNCKWLPVPFNQAFLAPGKYHLFGCWDLPMWPLEWWLPVFFFPWTLNLWTFQIPFPYWLKSPKDGFLWPGWWVYPSLIRIYAAPTLTAQLWIAICMWPYMSEHIFPSPLSDVAGNCVVFAVKPQCKADDNVKKKDKDNPNEIYENFIEDVRDSWVCLQSQKWPLVTEGKFRSSPFDLYSYSVKKADSNQGSWNDFSFKWTWNNVWQDIKWWENIDVNGWENNNLEFDVNFLWVINLETSAYIWGNTDDSNKSNSLFIWDVDVLWWDFNVNKIKWWIQQWLRKILIDKWLDPQIRYIVNQLTKMHVNIKLPDVSSLVTNEIQTMKNAATNLKNMRGSDQIIWIKKQDLPSITTWSDINHENLENFNNAISNPFEALANLMNESNIINISVEPITVKIPMIFSEDINEYSIYLQQWLEVNKEILNGWESVLSESEFDLALKNWDKLQNQVYNNLMILQKYRNFPFEIYEWIHVIERYMSEIASLINSTIWYLSYWTSTNSQRFVWYVDAIVLILNIIRTYQLLIDFSVERWQNCWNCTKDTYDQYSCKLSLLCDMIQLPIIQIPNFKLPNITLDFSKIDMSLDIILPDFNFQPVKVALPQIPNLPEAPSLWLGIKLNLPDIPLLPEPPELPELPSFIPEVEIELPILPPAPEVPRLPSQIEWVIKVAKLIWKIYCIVKWKFWLVWESSVKAKIEQLTQRTYEVKWIDTIMDFTNRSVAPVHNYGLDYEISSEVDLQFDFSTFYNYLDTLTKSINNLSTSATNWLNSNVDNIISDKLGWTLEKIDGIDVDLDLELWMANSSNWNWNINWLLSDEIEYVDYNSAKSRLEDVLVYFNNETKDTTMWETIQTSIKSIKNQIDKTNSIVSNIEGIEKLQTDVISYLDSQKSEYDKLANLINNDYDSFLAMFDSQNVDSNSKSMLKTGELLTFNVKLFDVDPSTKDLINNITKTNPYQSILSNKKSVIEWYWNAINSNTANDLWLSESQYLVLRKNIWSMKDQITTMYSVSKPISSTELIAKNSRVSTNKTLLSSSESMRLWSNMEVADVIDPSVLSEWIYDMIHKWADSWKLTKVVYSESFASEIWENYYHTDKFLGGDIVLVDDGWIYLKCSWGVCAWWGWWYKKYYVSNVVNSIPYEETRLKFDNDTRLKIADWKTEVKNRKVLWQTYDSLQFSWSAKENVDGYLIKLVDRIDNSYEKSDYATVNPKYVLVLPDWINVDELDSLKLELLKKTDKISKLVWNDLIKIVYYDSNKDVIDIILTLPDPMRMWYYGRIASLNLIDNTYNITSPWSNQIVAWEQIVWDDMAPNWNPVLIRPSVGDEAVVSQWINLKGYVWTKYNLVVNWEDNVALSYINLSKWWKILDEKYTSEPADSVSTNIGIHTQEWYETFNAIWIDQFGNKTEKQIIVNYSIPDITITDISKNSDWKTISIKAELSQDIDQWNVSFQRDRESNWKTIKPNTGGVSDFSLKPWQDKIVWSPYSIGNEVAMYGKNWEVLALMNPDTAEIKIQSGYQNKYEVGVIVQNGLVLQLRDKISESSVFSISVPIDECLVKEAESYNIVTLPESWKMGMFNWWKSVTKDWNNVLFISPSCHLYSELWLEWTYVYDMGQNGMMLTLYQSSDLSKSNPIKLWVKVKPYFE